MSTILKSIKDWAEGLPFWEQAALDQIVSGRPFTDDDIDLLIQYILEDKKLREKHSERPQLTYLAAEIGKAASTNRKIRLVSISDLSNVNALAANQKLTFNEQLTVVYGDNGSGKSGYARLLGCAGFTRGDHDVYPNVLDSASAAGPQTAKFEISVDGDIREVDYTVGDACPDAASICVFDSKSVEIHLTKYNKIGFSPAGLSYLTELARVSDACTKRLNEVVAPLIPAHDFLSLFAGESEVKQLVRALDMRPDLGSIKRVAAVTPEEEARLEALDVEIAELKARDTGDQVAGIARTVQDLIVLRNRLSTIGDVLTAQAIAEAAERIAAVRRLQTAAEPSGASEFDSPDFTQTGTPAWIRFVADAKQLLALERSGGNDSADIKCMLCRQELSPDAKELLRRLWDFLDNESRSKELAPSISELERIRDRIAGLDLQCFGEQSVQRRFLEGSYPEIAQTIAEYLREVESAREKILESIDNLKAVEVQVADPSAVIGALVSAMRTLEQKITQLREVDPAAKIRELSAEHSLLSHRLVVRENIDAITKYVETLQWTEKARKATGTTTHITRKYNELFKELVTERYIERFEELLRILNCPLTVKIETKAQKGETMRQITLTTAGELRTSQKIEKVLSDGEKRAVALADFLTEISLNGPQHGIVLDDPVTSLDLGWKETVAALLVAEAAQRQVIIFTHDISFVYFLKKHAANLGVGLSSHWLWKKGDNQPGFVHLDDSPESEEDGRTAQRAKRELEQAINAPDPASAVSHLTSGFNALRTSYEGLVVFGLFRKVVQRFERRISIDRLKEVKFDQEVIDQIIEKYGFISGFIDGHLHADSIHETNTPDILRREIYDFEKLKGQIRKMQNTKGGSKRPEKIESEKAALKRESSPGDT